MQEVGEQLVILLVEGNVCLVCSGDVRVMTHEVSKQGELTFELNRNVVVGLGDVEVLVDEVRYFFVVQVVVMVGLEDCG